MRGPTKDRREPVFPFPRLAPGTDLGAVTDVPDPGAVSVVLGEGSMRADIAVVHVDGVIRAYVNSCPHAGTPLETFDGRFLDREDSSMLVCSTHGARFRVADGYCVSGPCRGLGLRPVGIRIENGRILVA